MRKTGASQTWPELPLAPARRLGHAGVVQAEPVVYREEAVALLFAVTDILDEVREIRKLLEDSDEEEEDEEE